MDFFRQPTAAEFMGGLLLEYTPPSLNNRFSICWSVYFPLKHKSTNCITSTPPARARVIEGARKKQVLPLRFAQRQDDPSLFFTTGPSERDLP